MTSLLFLLIAVVLSAAGTLVLWLRSRRPSSMESAIDEFHRGMQALAPHENASPRSSARPRRPGERPGGPPPG